MKIESDKCTAINERLKKAKADCKLKVEADGFVWVSFALPYDDIAFSVDDACTIYESMQKLIEIVDEEADK